MSIQNAAVLCDLNISVWTGRKLDKKVSEEVDAAKSTKTRAGNYHKRLLAGTKRLDNIAAVQSAARLFHYKYTLPWTEGGTGLLPMKNFFDYKAGISALEKRFWDSVDEFVNEYSTLVSAAAFQLGDLFNPNDYPSVDEVRGKFRFRYSFAPLPASGDFRVDVETQTVDELKQQYEEMYNDKINTAMKDAWDRLHETLTHLSEKLNASGMNAIRDSAILNAGELCGMLTKLNVLNDPKLEDARKRLESALCGVSGPELRKDEQMRADVKAKVDEILNLF